MAQIIDQIVKISIQDSVSGVTTTDVNTVAIVGRAASGNNHAAGRYSTAKKVGEDFGTGSELYAMAVKFFAQDSQPDSVVVVPAASVSDALSAVKDAAEKFDFYHVCLASGDSAVSAAVLENFQDWLADAKKVLHVQIAPSDGNSTELALMGDLSGYGADRVAVYLHSENLDTADDGTASGEFLNVALVALRCAADSARGTFAHKTVSGVAADAYGPDSFRELTDAGLNVIAKVSGEARVFFGTTCDSLTFIDQVVKDDWIRFNVQSRIFRLLGEANGGHGVNYDDAGIGAVAAAVLNVLNVAADTDHQYVMEDSASVDYKPYSYLKENYAEDVRKRNLPLISGRYARMNSIHTVVQVSLQVTL